MLEWKRVEFSIKKNGVSISASVSAEYFDAHVLPVITGLLEDMAARPETPVAVTPAPTPVPAATPERVAEPQALTVRAIAQRMAAHTAPDIMRAAAISLGWVQQREKFSWAELLAEVQKATGYWKKTHSDSAKHVLESLMARGTLVETTDGHYSLSPKEEADASLFFA